MLKTLATGFLARKFSRGVNRRTGNPLLRMAGVAAAGYVANRLVRGKQKRRALQSQQEAAERGYATQAV